MIDENISLAETWDGSYSDLKSYPGYYSTNDDDIIIEMFESVTNQPDDEEYSGAVYIKCYDGMIDTEEDSVFDYHAECKLGRLCEFIEEAYGVELKEKITDEKITERINNV